MYYSTCESTKMRYTISTCSAAIVSSKNDRLEFGCDFMRLKREEKKPTSGFETSVCLCASYLIPADLERWI